ncbi:gephyrin-like molybdotransferase Glp [Hyphobacterium sp.]|uniref:molybdopterin molybdotransferase MoeA n=1 Tax=Hyphobacterium sp. TaxID=2004662 RepID=UPI003BAB530A
MISLDEALEIIAAKVRPLTSESIDIIGARERILHNPVKALRTQPPFNASAMDGYAVRSADLTGKPVTLSITGESAAGHASQRPIEKDECSRISTGAVMPDGADQVVIQENCTRNGNSIMTAQAAEPGKHIRVAGIDFEAGSELLAKGMRLTPAAISLAVSAGIGQILVSKQPRVGILSSGNELVEPGAKTAPGQIINSLGPGLSALVEQWGGIPVYLGIARDDAEDVRAKLAQATDVDLLVTIGGASVGDHDHLRRVFGEMGGKLWFEKIAIKPGKPTWFGALSETRVLGLPGNPVSAMVMAQLCLKPLLNGMLGRSSCVSFHSAALATNLPPNGPRENMLRARLDEKSKTIRAVSNQDSSALSGLASANALIRRLPNAVAAAVGDQVSYLCLDDM